MKKKYHSITYQVSLISTNFEHIYRHVLIDCIIFKKSPIITHMFLDAENMKPVDGGWGSWDAWSSCSVSCGSGGTKTRTRLCNNPEPEYFGQSCPGTSSSSESCSKSPCPGQFEVQSHFDTKNQNSTPRSTI